MAAVSDGRTTPFKKHHLLFPWRATYPNTMGRQQETMAGKARARRRRGMNRQVAKCGWNNAVEKGEDDVLATRKAELVWSLNP